MEKQLKPCSTCRHWQPRSPGAYFAPCAIGYGRTAHNDTCGQWARLAVDMQSMVRG